MHAKFDSDLVFVAALADNVTSCANVADDSSWLTIDWQVSHSDINTTY